MRRTSPISLLLIASACAGGGSDVVPPTTPVTQPPPATLVATSVAMQEGDNQTAQAGDPLPVAPSVVVRDQNGAPMAGVSVAFTVDSGGGSVPAPLTTSNASGVASSGRWTVGVGRNRLRASVAGLAPVLFTGTGTGQLTVVEGAISGSGGALRVTKAGNPLDGLELSAPAGAFARTVAIRVKQRDTTTAPRRAGMRLASPVIVIESDAAEYTATGALSLRIPARTYAQEWPIVVAFNSLTGAMQVLPGTRVDSTTVMVVTRHLDGELLVGSSTAATLRSAQSSDEKQLTVAVYGVNLASLAGDFDSGYRPTVDDWEFDFWPAAHLIESGYSEGLAFASAWYYTQFKGARGNLNGRYQQAKGVQASNEQGIRLGSVLYRFADVKQQVRDMSFLIGASIEATLGGAGMSVDSVTILNLKAGLFLTGRPQVMLAVDSNNVSPDMAMIVYRIRGSSLDITLGTNATGANTPRALTLTNRKFPSMSWSITNGLTGATVSPLTYNTYFITGETAGIPLHDLDAQFAKFFAGTIGDAEFPVTRIITSESRNVGDTLFVPDDSTLVWFECAACPYSYPAGPGVQSQSSVIGANSYVLSGATWTTGPIVTGAGLKLRNSDNGRRIGFGLFAPNNSARTQSVYSDWQEAVVKTKRLSLSPDTLNGAGGVDYTLTATYSRPTPANARWRWDLGDGQVLNTSTNSVVVRYSPPDAAQRVYSIKVTMTVGSVTEATGHSTAIMSGCAPTFLDARDNATYKQVCIGDQTWMGENLRFAMAGSRCYNDVTANCISDGRLYEWTSIMNGGGFSNANPSGVRGICPASWHVPSMNEWDALLARYGGRSAAGLALIRATGWIFVSGTATNASGMDIKPAGGYGGTFPPPTPAYYGRGYSTALATTTEETVTGWPVIVGVGGSAAVITNSGDPTLRWYSLRCVKDR